MKNYLVESMSSYMDKLEKNTAFTEAISGWNEDEYTHYTFRCQNCPALVAGDNDEWICDELELPCEAVEICPEGLGVLLNPILTEARNPENDEINFIIRKWASKDGRLTKQEKELLSDRGIELERGKSNPYGRYPKVRKDEVKGPNGVTLTDVQDLHPDYDIANKLTKEHQWPRRVPTNDIKTWYNHSEGPNPHDVSEISMDEFKNLQPYNREKEDLYWKKDNVKRAEERVKYALDELEKEKARKSEVVTKAKAKHNARKNESLNEDISNIEYFVGDNETGYPYHNEQEVLNAVKEYIKYAQNTDGCEVITIQVIPSDGAGNNLNESLNHWTDVYKIFDETVNKYFPDENKIEIEVKKMYEPHKGEDIWDTAYSKWAELDESCGKKKKLKEDVNKPCIKVCLSGDIAEDAWDYPLEEIDYLINEYPGGEFVFKDNRLWETEEITSQFDGGFEMPLE